MAFCQDISELSAIAVHFAIFCLLASIALISVSVPCLWLNSDLRVFFPKEAKCHTVLHQPIACWEGGRNMRKAEVQLVISGGVMPQILDSVLKISIYKLYTNKYVNP